MNRAIVCPLWGPSAFRKVVLSAGERLFVGRNDGADFGHEQDEVSARDPGVELLFDGARGFIRCLGSTHTPLLINGQQASSGSLQPGGWFRVSQTTFGVFHERARSVDAGALPEPHGQVVAALRDTPTELALYAVVDATRDERIRPLLLESPDELCSLFAGAQGDALAEVAPYLVRLDRAGGLLEHLVQQGWGQGWALFLTCSLPLLEVRRHLRRLLRVRAEGARHPFYFRFYDPRVLRSFLPQCTKEQRLLIHGCIQTFYAEGPRSEMLCFSHPDPLAATPQPAESPQPDEMAEFVGSADR